MPINFIKKRITKEYREHTKARIMLPFSLIKLKKNKKIEITLKEIIEIFFSKDLPNVLLNKIGFFLLKEIYSASDKTKLKLFLCYGTLLGHIRENSVIKHDRDLDIGMLAENEKEIGNLKKELKKRNMIIKKRNPYLYKARFKEIKNLHCDIWLFEQEGEKRRIKQYPNADPEKNQSKVLAYPKETIEKLQKSTFMNKLEVYIPTQSKKWLEMEYGDWKKVVKW